MSATAGAAVGLIDGRDAETLLHRASLALRRAKEAILTGTPFSAEDAFDWGLVNKLFDDSTAVKAAAIDWERDA